MSSARSIVARDDTLLGVCFALGEDFGFNPVFLRALLAVIVLWSLPAALAVYASLGALVAVSRWIAPNPLPAELAAGACFGEPCEELRLAA